MEETLQRDNVWGLSYSNLGLFYRYIPEGLGCSCGPDWYTNNEEYHCASYTKFLIVTRFLMPIIFFSYSQLLGALRAVSSTLSGLKKTKQSTV